MISYIDERHENAVALTSQSQVVTYSDLKAEVAAAVTSLRSSLTEMKTVAAQHILVVVDHSIRSVVWLLAATEVGLAIPVTPRELSEGRLSNVTIDLAVAPQVQDAAMLASNYLCYTDLDVCSEVEAHATRSCDDLAVLVSTSGTTGAGKWIAHSQSSIRSASTLVIDELQLRPGVVSLAVMPLNHTHGLVTTLIAPLMSGGTVILAEPHDVASMRWAMSQPVSCVSASPTLHRYLLKVAQLFASSSFGPDRIRSASDVLTRTLLEQMTAAYGVPVVDSYALTELPGTILTRKLKTADDLDAPYRPVGSTQCFAENISDPSSIRGELLVDGPHRMCGIYDMHTRQLIEKTTTGSVRSGDIVESSGDCGFVLVGRIKEMINRGGETVSPARVEDLIEILDCVSAAMAFAEKHDALGEAVSVAVTVVPGSDSEDVERQIREAIPAGWQPITVYIVDELAYKENGKADRNAIRDQVLYRRGGSLV